MQHVQDTAQTDWLLLKPRTQTGTALREPELRDMMIMGVNSSFSGPGCYAKARALDPSQSVT